MKLNKYYLLWSLLLPLINIITKHRKKIVITYIYI